MSTARRRLALLARLTVAAALVAWVLSRADPGQAWAALATAPRWIWPAAVGLYLVNTLLYTSRVLVLLEPRPPFWLAVRAVLMGNFAGFALPSGAGEAAKVVALAPHTGGADRALAAVAASRAVELIVWASLVVWAALAVLPGRLDVLVPIAWLAAAAMATAAGVAGAIMVWGSAWIRPLPGRLGAFVASTAHRFAALGARPERLLMALLLVVPFALVNCLTVWTILGAYGVPLSYPTVLGLIPTVDLFIALPVTIAGIGVRETLFVFALEPFGVGASTALAVALTRWAGHLGRAVIGAVLWGIGRSRPTAASGSGSLG